MKGWRSGRFPLRLWRTRQHRGALTISRERRVLIILENLPLERDARVRRECLALLEAGYGVSVVCPKGSGARLEGALAQVKLHQYRPPSSRTTRFGFAYEFSYSWLTSLALTLKALAGEGFDVIQACNPPDTYFALAAPFKLLGKPFIFDHHDLAPELYAIRFGRDRGMTMSALKLCERATIRCADHVISTNESLRHVAITRGKKSANVVTVVRNGPELSEVRSAHPQPKLKRSRRFLCCWVGVMGAVDDGVDLALRAIHLLVGPQSRHDCHFAFIGDGEELSQMRALANELGIGEFVTFTGWLDRARVFDYLATADVGLQPDPKNPRTDAATAIKTMEYMAFGLPIVAFDVHETRVSAEGAAVYARPNDVSSYAELIGTLLDSPEQRAAMGRTGRQRIEHELAWDHQRTAYVDIFHRYLQH